MPCVCRTRLWLSQDIDKSTYTHFLRGTEVDRAGCRPVTTERLAARKRKQKSHENHEKEKSDHGVTKSRLAKLESECETLKGSLGE